MQQPTAMDQTPPQLTRQQEIAPTSGTDPILQQLAQIQLKGNQRHAELRGLKESLEERVHCQEQGIKELQAF